MHLAVSPSVFFGHPESPSSKITLTEKEYVGHRTFCEKIGKSFYMSSYHIKNQSSMAPAHTHTHTHRAKRESAHRMKKVGPTPLFLFSPFHRASLFDEGVSSAKTNRCSVREPRRGRKNSRRATRKRLLKRELCKRESVFFHSADECFCCIAHSGFFITQKKSTLFTLPQIF